MTATFCPIRARYVRDRWLAALKNAGDRPVALYGAGRHTRWFLEQALGAEDLGRLKVLLDDSPRSSGGSIRGIPVVPPGDVRASTFGAVVASSDGFEAALLRRARAWAGSARSVVSPATAVCGLYEGLPAGPYDGSHEPIFAEIIADGRDPATVIEDRFGPLTRVRRLEPPAGPASTVPIPPVGRRSGYDGDDAWYLGGGRAAAEAVLRCVRAHAGPEWSPRVLLEWGCSSARVLRHMPDLAPSAACWGCDIDPWSVEWASGHLAPRVRVFRSTPLPPLPFESGSLDLVYAVSVFTHLSAHWDTWLMELRRVLRPGGYLFASINDERVWAQCGGQPPHEVARLCPRLDFSRPLTDDFVAQGDGAHAQSFWSSAGVRRRWAFALDVLGFHPGAVEGVQTGVVLQRPLSAG